MRNFLRQQINKRIIDLRLTPLNKPAANPPHKSPPASQPQNPPHSIPLIPFPNPPNQHQTSHLPPKHNINRPIILQLSPANHVHPLFNLLPIL